MKATGIVRRIDDLGRVVIPKEIRRTMRIREGDPSHTSLKQKQTTQNSCAVCIFSIALTFENVKYFVDRRLAA